MAAATGKATQNHGKDLFSAKSNARFPMPVPAAACIHLQPPHDVKGLVVPAGPKESGVRDFAVVALPKWPRASSVGVAAAFVLTVVAALWTDAGGIAAAQGRLQAEYVATISGVPVGHGNWIVEISDTAYTAMASGSTAGVLKVFSGAHGSGTAQGTIADGHPFRRATPRPSSTAGTSTKSASRLPTATSPVTAPTRRWRPGPTGSRSPRRIAVAWSTR